MRTWFPFISLDSHREVIAAKNDTIALQRETIKQLTDSLEAFREASRVLRETAANPPRRQKKEAEEPEPRAAINYASLDPENSQSLVDAAMAELGPGRHTMTQVMRKAEAIKRQIALQRRADSAQALTPPQPLPTKPQAAPPAAVLEAIDQAIHEGQSAAAAEVN